MTEQQLRKDIKDVLDQMSWLGDLVMDADVDKALDEIMSLVREYNRSYTFMELPLPAGYQVEPHFTTHTRPMRIDT